MNAFVIITIVIAVSYGWGMRGSWLGGERGAVLPGALLGMLLALFSGSTIIAQNFYYFAGAGALGMAFGGTETYGQTMGFILNHTEGNHNPNKGYIGLILKGALWFGICGAVLGLSFSVAGGKYYSPAEIGISVILIPLMQALGIFIFNKPYNPKNDEKPKIYFSISRREEWGGNLITLVYLIVFATINKDFYTVFFALTGIFGGAVGWVIGIRIYDIQSHPLKSGKYLFGKFHNHIDGWKIMEFTLGAVGGLFYAVYFIATKNTLLQERIDLITENSGIWNPLGKFANYSAFIFIALVLLTAVQYPLIKRKAVSARAVELTERVIFFIIPLALILLGSIKTAQFVAFSMIVYFAAEKIIFEKSENTALRIIYAVITVACVICQCFLPLPPIAYILMYGFFYIITDSNNKDNSKSRPIVISWFIILALYLTLTVLFTVN